MKRRRITIELTEVQFNGLARAVATLDAEVDDMIDDGDREGLADVRAALRAWGKINAAWYARERTRGVTP